MENTKPCPFCAEPIQAAAVKCRFCNSMLTTPSAPGAVTTVEQTAKKWKGLRLAAVVMILVSFIGVLAVVRLAPHTVRPDLVGWRRERMPAMPALQEDGVVELRPDWICEILSPGHAADDLVRKRRIYHQHQVPHYWIIDPRDSTLTVNRWSAAGFVAVLVAQAGDVVRAEPFDQVELPVAELFLDDEG